MALSLLRPEEEWGRAALLMVVMLMVVGRSWLCVEIVNQQKIVFVNITRTIQKKAVVVSAHVRVIP